MCFFRLFSFFIYFPFSSWLKLFLRFTVSTPCVSVKKWVLFSLKKKKKKQEAEAYHVVAEDPKRGSVRRAAVQPRLSVWVGRAGVRADWADSL